MKLLRTIIAATAIVLFGTSGVALAGDDHHGHHGHHGHHSGFHFSFGHGLHHYYGRNHRYPSYSYSYTYPRSRTYSYYRSPSCYAPSVIYSQPVRKTYSPQQAPAEQYEKQKVEPTPPAVPSNDLPIRGFTRRSGSATRFTALTRGQPEAHHYGTSASDETVSLKTAAFAGALGPQLAAPPVRRIISDDEMPWVVGESTFQEPESSGKIAVTGRSTADRPTDVPNVREGESVKAASVPSIPAAMRGVALLDRADQSAALTQRTCLVTGDLLGSDGKPIKVQVDGRDVFACCEGCIRELKAAPARYFADTL